MAGKRMRVLIPSQTSGASSTAVTLLQARPRAHQGNEVKKVTLWFSGADETQPKILVEFLEFDSTSDGTPTGTVTPTLIPPSDSTMTAQTTFHHTFTAEPTVAGTVRDHQLIAPTGRYDFYALDKQLEQFTGRWGLRLTNSSATAVTVRGVVEVWE
jgi:hypothetical protein